jgi:hypothetical protein
MFVLLCDHTYRFCSKCGRKFSADRIGKHEAVCKATAVSAPKKAPTPTTSTTKTNKTNNGNTEAKKWKNEHEQLQQMIHYARQVKKAEEQGIDVASIAPPPAAQNLDYIQW